jgi:hypothetical protein
MHAAVAKRIDSKLMAANGPIVDPKVVAAITGEDEEAKQVLLRINSRKAVEGIYDWEQNFRSENLSGFSVILERGILGLKRIAVL